MSSLGFVWSVLNSSFAMNAGLVVPPFATTVPGSGVSLGNGSELALAIKSFGSTVVSTLVEAAVVVLGLILWVVKGTGSVLVMDVLDPIVVLFDVISAICTDVAVVPPNAVSVPPPFTTVSSSCADARLVELTVVVLGLIHSCPLSSIKTTTTTTRMTIPATTSTLTTVPTSIVLSVMAAVPLAVVVPVVPA